MEALGLQNEVKLAIVQTAYANGAYTQYLKSNGFDVVFAKTGVCLLLIH